jgi:hypothetical protein
MAKAAKKLKSGAGWENSSQKKKIDQVRMAKEAKGAFLGETFESLNGAQKDDLLKALAIKAGLIEPS